MAVCVRYRAVLIFISIFAASESAAVSHCASIRSVDQIGVCVR